MSKPKLSGYLQACLLLGLLLYAITLNLQQSPHTSRPDIWSEGFFGLSVALLTVGGLAFAIQGFATGFVKPTSLLALECMVGIFVVLPAAVGEFCRELSLQFGGYSGVPSGDAIAHAGTALAYHVAWAQFALSWLVDTLTFNATQVFHWVRTPIGPNAWWSGALVAEFCLVADMVLFASAVTLIKRFFGLVRRK